MQMRIVLPVQSSQHLYEPNALPNMNLQGLATLRQHAWGLGKRNTKLA
jgi:hypothetical protein